MALQIDGSLYPLNRKFEGYEENVYPDSNGNDSIGVGHKLTQQEINSKRIIINGKSIDYSEGLTSDQIAALWNQDVQWAVNFVNKLVKVPLSQNQFNALVDFGVNIGIGEFQSSTLLRLLNQKMYNAVPAQLMRWDHDDNGNVVSNLQERREAEVVLWNTK